MIPQTGAAWTRPRTWIFQANPNKYRILDSLQTENGELWNLNQHAGEICTGDRVLLWICGLEAGIYAIGTVTSDPMVMSDSPVGMGYWRVKSEGRRRKPRSFVRYDRLFLDQPLRKVYLEFDPALSNLRILRYPRGTNFPVTDQEWLVINAWLTQP